MSKKLNVITTDIRGKGEATFNGNKRLMSYKGKDLKAVARYEGTGCLDEDGSFIVPCAEIDGYVYRLAHDCYTDAELELEKQSLASSKEGRDKALREGVQSILDYMQSANIVDDKLTSLVKSLLPEDKKVTSARSALSKLSADEMKALLAEMQAQLA